MVVTEGDAVALDLMEQSSRPSRWGILESVRKML